jgi:hypothetical protein
MDVKSKIIRVFGWLLIVDSFRLGIQSYKETGIAICIYVLLAFVTFLIGIALLIFVKIYNDDASFPD